MDFVVSKINDKIKFFEKTGKVVSTNFLTPAEVSEVYSEFRGNVFCISGGYEGAERNIVIVGSDADVISDFCTVIRCKTTNKNVRWKNSSNSDAKKILGHRDVLGSILGLGIKREMIGDILLSDNFCDIIIMREMSEYILTNLESIGREKVKCEVVSFEDLTDRKISLENKVITVASLRLDALISAVFGISREKSSEFIKLEKVSLGFILCKNTSKIVCENDLISVRGYGRFKVLEVAGETRKGRIRVKVGLRRRPLKVQDLN